MLDFTAPGSDREPDGFVGTTMKINGLDHTIVGVAPQGFAGTMALISPELWVPLGMFDVVFITLALWTFEPVMTE